LYLKCVFMSTCENFIKVSSQLHSYSLTNSERK